MYVAIHKLYTINATQHRKHVHRAEMNLFVKKQTRPDRHQKEVQSQSGNGRLTVDTSTFARQIL